MTEHFVQKNPDLPFADQSPIKQRLLLAPRNTMKTSIDEVNLVQWFLSFPGIRILLLTGTQNLGERMVAKCTSYLQHECIRLLFPELGIPDPSIHWGYTNEFTIPNRPTDWREPSLSNSTISSAKASGHYECLVLDDTVGDTNSKTPDQIQKVIDCYADALYLLEPDSYVDVIGTRWESNDLYGELLKREEDLVAAGEPLALQVCKMAAWKLKQGVILQQNDYGAPIMHAEDVELLYPDRLKFSMLNKQYRANPYAFSCQQLNQPDPLIEALQASFPLDMLLRHKLPYDSLPYTGKKYICWDLSGYSQRAGNDYTCGVVGIVDDQHRLFVLDIIRGRYNPVQQASAIVEAAKQWQPETTIIEDAQGARALEPTVVRTAQECRVNCPIMWASPPRFKDAKKTRIGFLATMLRSDRLWFANYVDGLKYLFEELTAYPYSRHDDVSDALSMLVLHVGDLTGLTTPAAPKIDHVELRRRAFEHMLFDDTTPVTSATGNQSGLLGMSLLR
jgi:predicted phage terminase large subunit-like protein